MSQLTFVLVALLTIAAHGQRGAGLARRGGARRGGGGGGKDFGGGKRGGKGGRARLYCLVPGVWQPKFQRRRKEIMDTWGQRCDVIRFMVDPEARGTLPENVINVSTMVRRNGDRICSDKLPCRHIWEKVWRSWLWVAACVSKSSAKPPEP